MEKIWARATWGSRSLVPGEGKSEQENKAQLCWRGGGCPGRFCCSWWILSSLSSALLTFPAAPKTIPKRKVVPNDKISHFGGAFPNLSLFPVLRNPAVIQPLHFQLSQVSWSSLGEFLGRSRSCGKLQHHPNRQQTLQISNLFLKPFSFYSPPPFFFPGKT